MIELLRRNLRRQIIAVIPAGVKASTERFAPRERSMAIGRVNVGTAMGAVLALPLVSALAIWFNGRAAFLVTGAMGLVWAAAWYWLYQPRPSTSG